MFKNEDVEKAIADGKIVRAPEPTHVAAFPPPPVYPAEINQNFVAPLPAGSWQSPDQQRQWQNASLPQIRVTPLPPSASLAAGAAAASQALAIPSTATTTINNTTVLDDGITHGRKPWPGDAGVVEFWDDFHGQNSGTFGSAIPNSAIGQLGWSILGSTSTLGGNLGGVPPYIGQFAWGNVGVQNDAAWMIFNSASGGTGSSSYTPNSWALGENPGWIVSYVFKVDGSLNSSLNFEMTQKSLYIGLTGPAAATTGVAAVPCSRPDVFIGIRYDTTPTIADAFFTLEVVANITTNAPARNNTQGTTLVTSVAPVIGEWHRLDIICNVAGMVTLTLDGSATNTLTTAIPVMTFTTATNGISANEGIVRLDWGGGATDPVNPWGSGSSVTVAGFSAGGAALNGIHELTAGASNLAWFDFPGNFGASDTVTLSAFPSLFPLFLFGDDDTATPTANTAFIFVDYWSFVWNPNLGPGAPGVPDATKPRYF